MEQRARRAWSATIGAELRARTPGPGPWFEVNATDADTGAAEVYVRGVIGGWWEDEDTVTAPFVTALNAIDADQIRLHINSPGGYVVDGIEIYNAVRDHPATVHVIVDSLAASAASFIAMAGDRITMNRGSDLMIHDAWGGIVGNAAELRAYADRLEGQSRKIAGFYAAKAGGSPDDWFALMDNTETWFSAVEAVEAGLADDAVELAEATPGGDAEARLPYHYQGRADAPAPGRISTDTAPEAAPTPLAAVSAAGREATARQRRDEVDAHRAVLAQPTNTRRQRR
jgi:ATP-dependent protease ClpP protease subunit